MGWFGPLGAISFEARASSQLMAPHKPMRSGVMTHMWSGAKLIHKEHVYQMSTLSSVNPASRASLLPYASIASGSRFRTSSSSVTMVTWMRDTRPPNSSLSLVMRMFPKCLNLKPAFTDERLRRTQFRFLWPVCHAPSA